MTRVEIFLCYAREDMALMEQLERHLIEIKRQQLANLWYDHKVNLGADRQQEIEQHLNTAHIILLLVSPDFIACDDCYNVQMKKAMERHERREAWVVPVILRPVDWQRTPFGRLQPLPTNGEPVTTWQERDAAFLDIVQGIQRAVRQLSPEGESILPPPSPSLFQPVMPNTKPPPKRARLQQTTVNPRVRVMPIGAPRLSTFVGREEYLDELIPRLRAGKTTGICALNGMGGIGKTALAAEIVWRLSQDHRAFPGGALWVSCEGLDDPEGLSRIWQQIAHSIKLKFPENDPDISKTLARELAEFPYLLIALDNIEPKLNVDVLLNTLVIPGHTALLLTARQALSPERLISFKLPPLSTNDAANLFGQILRQQDYGRLTPQDESSISQIVLALGYLPLAIALVASYAGELRLHLTRILWELEQDGVAANSLNSDPDPRRALISRFNRSWAVLSSEEQQLFAGLSLFDGRVFPREAAIGLAHQVRDRDLMNVDGPLLGERNIRLLRQEERVAEERVNKLIRYALVEPLRPMQLDPEQLRLHPLLHEYATMRLEEYSQKQKDELKHALRDAWLSLGQRRNNLRPDPRVAPRNPGRTIGRYHRFSEEELTAIMEERQTSHQLPAITTSNRGQIYSISYERGMDLLSKGEEEIGLETIIRSNVISEASDFFKNLIKDAKERNNQGKSFAVCPSCGSEKRPGSNFCPVCGKKL